MRFEAVDGPATGIDAGGRTTLDGATAARLAGLAAGLAVWAATEAEPADLTTRLVIGSTLLASTGLASTGLASAAAGSAARTAASTGRGRGNGLATATVGGGSVTTDEPNIGDG